VLVFATMGGFVGLNGTLPQGQPAVRGFQGAPGPQGPPGAGSPTFSLPAPATVSQYAPLISSGSSVAVADSSNVAHAGKVVGIAAISANVGDNLDVQFQSTIVNSGWNWDVTKPVYLNGSQLSQTPPTTGFVQIIGVPVTPTTLLIQLQPPCVIAA
jgi:hypothetical protein